MILADPELPDCMMFNEAIPWVIGAFVGFFALAILAGLFGAWLDARRERRETTTTPMLEEDEE